MTTSTAYTPLELLLLFQSLQTIGTDPSSFIKISDLLKGNVFVREGKTFDTSRLSPDALRQLYQDLLQEELKDEESRNADDRNGDSAVGMPTANSKKRKLQSPPRAILKDASQQAAILPQLVDRLYARYRDFMVREIREDERRYSELQREIEEIERGEWDERLRSQPSTPAKELKPAPIFAQRDNGIISQRVDEPTRTGAEALHNEGVEVPDGHGRPISSGSQAVQPALSKYTSPPAPQPKAVEQGSQGEVTQGFVPQPQPKEVANVPVEPADRASDPSSTLTPQLQPTQPTVQDSPTSPLATSKTPDHLQNTPLAPQTPVAIDARPSRPNILSTNQPLSAKVSDSSSNELESADMSGSHRSMQEQQQPVNQPSPIPPIRFVPIQTSSQVGGSPVQPHAQQPQNLPQSPDPPQYAANPPVPARTVSPENTPSSIQSSQILPSMQTTPQSHPGLYYSPYNPAPVQTPASISASQVRAPPNQAPGQAAAPASRVNHLKGSNWATQSLPPSTPIGGANRPYPLTFTGSRSSTRWKGPDPYANTPDEIPRSPKQPTPEPPSPILQAQQLENPKRDMKRQWKTATEQIPLRTMTPRGRTPGRGRGRGRYAGTGRGGNAVKNSTRAMDTSSPITRKEPVRARTRSQSVFSHPDELSLDVDIASRKVKHEPPPTPADLQGDVDITGETTAEESTQAPRRGRKRRGTLKVTEGQSPRRTASKRKHGALGTPDAEATFAIDSPALPPQHVQFNRNFPRVSGHIINQILGHRYASTFSAPVRERDAPGYKSLIYRPQDLKSIKAAVGAGGRAGLAVLTGAGSVGTPTGETASPAHQGSSTPLRTGSEMLPISSDLVPPKGIVNSAQLEKELMRMFANAVMFNPDPSHGLGPSFDTKTDEDDNNPDEEDANAEQKLNDFGAVSVIEETAQMMQHTEKIISELRSAEIEAAGRTLARGASKAAMEAMSGGADDETDELAGDGDRGREEEDGGQGAAKRRRRG